VSPSFLEHPVPAAELTRLVRQFVRQHHLFQPGDRVLVAVSGGPDSVALLQLLRGLQATLGLSLGVAHFDHNLRGRESDEDAEFVRRLATELGLDFHLGQGDVRGESRAHKISLQMAARKLRLGFLRETCRRHGYDKLALGHTADDQVELLLLRLLRGTGLEGLKGMEPAGAAGLVRPLLAVGKTPLLAYLQEQGLAFRQDSSNLSRAYLRNRIRLELLPELRERYNPRLGQAIWRLQQLLREDAQLLAAATQDLVSRVTRLTAPDFLALDLHRLLALEAAWQSRVVRAAAAKAGTDLTLTTAQVDSLLALARGGRSGGLLRLGPDHRAARAGWELHFFRRLPEPPPAADLLLPAAPCEVTASGWRWRLASRPHTSGQPWPPPGTAWLDLDRLSFPLQVRGLQPGDRFWPLGAAGSQKLQDFLVNSKIPRWLRPYLPLLVSRGEIIWLPGLRPAASVKLTPASTMRLEIELAPQAQPACRIWELMAACRRESG
jgi:tRNA(Ile)-lysidine synthase